MSNVKVAFICVHNSCRSQIAEAFGRHLASDVFQSYSAGTETKPQINQDAVRIMKELYNIDMEADGQFSKLVSDIPNPDIAISMGCNVGCPFIGRPFDDNWGLEDPTGKSDEEFKIVIETLHTQISSLFLGKDGTALAYQVSGDYMRWLGFFFIFMGIKMATDGVLRGLGIMRPFLVANMVNLAIRLSVALICAPCFGIAFVWLAVPAGWLANFLISYVALRKSWPIDKSNLSR